MSLNGLDDAKVKEAYDAAAAEPGGWFLLKYASRDEVDLLGRGNGGVAEMRNAISEYEEASPLYGFLRYRRRNVLIKYLPEDCSRLIQARMSVHFTAVCEHFSPHDTTFSIATANELKDSKLSAACSLHAASGSTSSSTSSIRRRRLGEIAEEDEEERASKRQSVGETEADAEAPSSTLETSPPPPRPETPVTLNADPAASPDQGNFTTATDPPDFTGANPTSPRKSFDTTGRRLSSQSTRPEFYSSLGRQKVRLAPRPSADGRPRTAAPNFRPISSIPAGFKARGKKGKSKDGTDDVSIAELSEVSELTFTPSNIPIPPMPESPGVEEPRRPHTSSGASFVVPSFKAAAKEKVTPEKARLMKAMKLREKKKKMSMLPTAAQEPKEEANAEGEKVAEKSAVAAEEQESDKDDGVVISTADSAIVMEGSASTIHDHASDATQSDSHPASPFIASEAEQSTKASSLSESDETVQARDSIVEKDGEDVQARDSVMEKDGEETVQARESIVQKEDVKPTGESEETVAEATADAPSQDPVEGHKPADVPEDMDERSVTPAAVEEPAVAKEDSGQVAQVEATAQEGVSAASPAPEPSAPVTETQDTVEEAKTTEEDSATEPFPEPAPEPVSAPAPEPVAEPVPEPKPTEDGKSPQLRIPKSKFSTPDLKAAAKAQEEPPVPALDTEAHRAANGAGKAEQVAEDINEETKGKEEVKGHRKAPSQASNLDPIRTDLPVTKSARSSRHLSVDESLLDELQSAVVEEAMPVAVSPLSPTFSGQEGAPMASTARAVSQPHSKKPTLLSPTDIPLPKANRSVSSGTAFLNRISQSQQSGAPAPKKSTIGSSISQRIKALEKLSSNGPEGEARPSAPAAGFFAGRGSVREPSRSPSVVNRATSFSKGSPPGASSQEGSPVSRQPSRERSASLQNRLSMFETGVSPPRGRTESVQVRARIVRTDQPGERRDEGGALDLKQSPLVVDHQAMPELTPAAKTAPKETIQERRMSRETRRSDDSQSPEVGRKGRRSSISVMKDFIKDRRMSLSSPSVDNLPRPTTPSHSPTRPPSAHQPSLSRRLSISSRRSSFSRDMTPVGSPEAITETSSGDDARSLSSEKRRSRAGRFMRRLSSSLGGRSKSTPTGISPTLHEEYAPGSSGDTGGPWMAALMGDVNVQFPDNLLWKRRAMGLDSQGFVVLSTAATAGKQAGGGAGVRRFHLSEFRAVYTPDMEVQELPNSVVLDFLEGSGLQVACEDRAGQMSVLQILADAHRKHSSFGQ